MARIVISSGHVVSGSTITLGDVEMVLNGGSSIAPQVTNGGLVVVSSGGSVSGASLRLSAITDVSGARMVVSSGAVVQHTGVSGGAALVVSGGATLDTVVSGFHAFPDGPARQSTERVMSGGVANGTTIEAYGLQIVSKAGSSVDTTVGSRGREVVYVGGVADGTTVASGGYLATSGGGLNGDFAYVNDLLVSGSGAVANFVSGTQASGCVVVAGGTIKVGLFPWLSEVADTTVGSGGRFVLSRDCSASSTVILSGGLQILNQGFDYDVTVSSGGAIVASSLARLSNATIRGSVLLKDGSTASAVQVFSGGLLTLDASDADGLVIASGAAVVLQNGRLDGLRSMSAGGLTVGKGGALLISAGLSTTGGVVGSGGDAIVLSGGGAAGLKVMGGGTIEYAGGAVGGLVIGAGATEIVESGATLSGLHHSGANLVVSSGGTVRGAAVQSALLTVSSGGVVSDVRLRSAHATVLSGGRASGTTTFVQSSTLALAANTGILLTVAGFDATDTIGLAAFKFAGSHLSVVSSGSTTQVTVTNRLQQANIILMGQYSAAGFHLSQDGLGTDLTYAPPAQTPHVLAAGRGEG